MLIGLLSVTKKDLIDHCSIERFDGALSSFTLNITQISTLTFMVANLLRVAIHFALIVAGFIGRQLSLLLRFRWAQ